MKKIQKKAFTLVELLVVIAILAVLATVAILGYSSFTNKANQSNDATVVAELNRFTQAYIAGGGEVNTVTDIANELEKDGFKLSTIKTSYKKDYYAFNVNKNKKEFLVVTEEDITGKKGNPDLFVFVASGTELTKVNTAGYSAYLQEGFDSATTTIETSKGVDVGVNNGITSINYTNPGEHQEVVIRTNSFDTTLTINAPKDTIKHYDKVGSLNVIAVANASYHENGQVKFVEISKGRIALEAGSEVTHIHINAKVVDNEKQNEFEEIIISKEASVEMPDFSRDDVEIAAQGTLVFALQTGTKEITDSTELDYVWLTKQGVYEQITISDSSEKATTTIGSEEQSVWVNSSNKSDETKAAAQQIANNIGTTATINDVVYSVSVNDDRDIVLTTADHVTSEEVTYTLETQQDGTVVLKDDEGAPVDSSVATVASVVAQAVEEGGIDASAAEHLAYSVLKGDGTINNPYDIYNVETYIAFITMHLYNGETDYYYVAGDGIVYGNITDDIDFTGVTLPTPTVDYYNVVIEGNGHTLSNSNRALFTINGDWYGDKNEIRNLNIVNCNTGHTLLGTSPVWNDSSAKIVLSNINVKNCSCKNGVFAYYAGSSTMIFNNCNVEATTIQGGNGIALGGFVCNNSTGHTEFNNCSFGGNVISVSEAVSSFMGQGSSNTVFNNCAVKAGTSIRNLKTNGIAYAFGNSYASTSHDNTFEGTLYTTSMAKADGNGVVEVSSDNWQQQAVLSASDFVINSDGSITYNGSSTLAKVTVDVKASRDTITIGVNDSYGGYPYQIQDTITANNVAGGSSITGLTKITSTKNVVSEESDLTLIGRSIKDDSIFGDDSKAGDIKIVGNTLYLNSCRYGTHNDKLIAWADSFDKVAQEAKNSELSINLTVIVYDATGNLVSSIGLSYKVPVE